MPIGRSILEGCSESSEFGLLENYILNYLERNSTKAFNFKEISMVVEGIESNKRRIAYALKKLEKKKCVVVKMGYFFSRKEALFDAVGDAILNY